jgi:SdrD B-like domain
MKVSSTNSITNKRGLFAILILMLSMTTVSTFAHSVDSYSASCNGGPQYVVTAAISNVNSSSNYRWQWKNTSGAWVCFVNGANTINGNSYNVSGAVYNLTTTPGPIIFTNPTSGLQNLEIRMVISDGSGVNPCNLPAGNTWTSATNHFIDVSNTACASTNSCSCPGNVVLNPSFENGTTSWSWGGGTLNAGTGAVACGSFSGDFQITNNTNNWASQTIGTDLPVGTVINASVYAGTHDNSVWHGVIIDFFDANWNWISNSAVTVNKVLAAAPAGPQLYTWSGVVPANCKYTNIGFSGSGGWIKTDQWCVTTTPPVCTGKVTGIYFNKLDGGADLPITNGAIFTVGQLASLYNIEASTTGTIGSVKYTITGPTATSNIENTTPYNSPATGAGAWTGTPGTYTVNAKTYNSANGAGALCHDTTFTFVLSAGVSLGNQIFNDLNDNGVKDANEGGWPYGMTVNLYQDNNNDGVADAGWVPLTTNADGNGFYQFTGLVPGSYFVTLTNPYPVDWQKSSVNGGDPDNDVDNDNNGVSGTATIKGQTITLALGTEPTTDGNDADGNNTYDFGMWKGNGLGDYVFLDANANGIQDAGETGIANVSVTLSKGATTYTTTTDANGYYFFADIYDLANGGYTLTFATPAGLVASPANLGGDDSKDSDPVGGVITGITVPIGTWNHTFDAGFYYALSLGDRVFIDLNDNGVRDATEVGLPGVTVNLYLDANNDNIADGAAIQTATTDGTGNYRFNNLAPNNYIVGAIVPAGYRSSTLSGVDPDNNTDLDDNGNNTVVAGEVRGLAITLSVGAEPLENGNYNHTYDFGFTGTGSIGDFVFVDANGNGLQDGGEVGISGVTVTLTYPDGTVITTTTNGSGNYVFNNLPPTAAGQSYTVTFATPAGYTPTTSNVGGNDVIDSDPIGGVVSGITLTPGQVNTTIDAGFYQLLNLGNFVWGDKNNNGVQDAGELGINGATVNLYRDANGDNVPDGAAIGTTTTSGGGLYGFGSLAPGNYIVGVVIPAGYVVSSTTATSATPNNDNLVDNNGVTTVSGEVRSNFITLSSAGEPTNDGDANLGNLTLDFGLRSIASLGDKVWRDDNKNGVQDAGEPGVAGITVSLFDNTGKLVGSTVTDAYGNYLFSNLPAGDYSVSVTLPANYTFTSSTGTSKTDATNSDVNAITGATTTITLAPGENNVNIDAGIIFNTPTPKANIGDRVWLDIDKDGIQDAGEPGVAGVTVTLFDNTGAIVATAVTDANGNYLFTDVPAGTGYTIGFTAPAGTVFSPKDATADNNDSDADPVTGKTAPFTVVAGTTDLSFDAGIYPQPATKASLGDRVWNDLNKDGKQDAGEQGIAGVTVNLYAANGTTLLGTTKTDAFGNYIFTNLNAGTYVVEFIKPSGYTSSPKDAGTDDAKDSDADVATGKTAPIVLAAGDRNTTVDAGMYVTTPAGLLQLGDKVFNDENRDGVQNATEDGVSGITVILYQNGVDGLPNTADDVKLKTTTTDVNGNYLFTDLAASTNAATNYNVQFSNLPSGYNFTTQDQTLGGGNDTNDSDPNTVTGRTGSINLTANNLTVDAGIVQGVAAGKGSLGDRVWYDMPGGTTGVQDATEQGVSGVTVKLYRDANNDGVISGAETTAIATTTTNALGNYMFGGLDAGNYQVGFSNLPAGFTLTTKDAGTDDAKDSDGNPLGSGVAGNTATAGTSYTGLVSLAQGEDNLTVDLGIVPPANTNSLGGDVWRDVNNDGVQTAGEPPVKGVMVTLYDAAGNPIATTVTDENGRYLFVGLPDGSYSVGFSSLPAGYNFTNQSATNDATGSDANVTTGRTTTVTLGPGNRNDTSLDAGLVTTKAALGDFVWFDTNGNGTQDAGEAGIAGVTVTLTRPGFGLDGIAGNADDALPVATAITDAKGGYFFGNLAVGNYVVNFATIPNNTVFTQQNSPGDNQNNTNSDANPSTGNSASIALSAGEIDLTIDAGVKPNLPGAVGNFVWNDLDGDGIQDANEPGVAGVLVTLYDAANNPIGSAITDGSGAYLITNVPAGTGYYVIFSNLPNGAVFTTQDQTAGGGDDTNDSDANPTTGRTGSITVVAGEVNTTVDAGIKTSILNLGNFVWYDKNNNGTQDAGEQGVVGATVKLYSDANGDNVPDGAAIATTTTDANGLYNFNSLIAGNYIVGVVIPTGYAPAATTATSVTPNNDNNTDNNGTIIDVATNELRNGNSITLSIDGEPNTPADGDSTNGNLTLDFGLRGTAALGNFVWEDRNKNGVQDAGEPGLQGVTVTLTRLSDNTTQTTTTDANGAYSFNNLVPGAYNVNFTTPATYTPTLSNVGTTTDELDSDPIGGVVSVTLANNETNNTIDAGYIKLINIYGNVWHDANALADNLVNQTSATPIPPGIRAYLVDNVTGLIVARANVSGTGTFSFLNVTGYTSYRVVLSTVSVAVGQPAPGTVLPVGWTNTGEKLGNAAGILPGSDGLPDGKLNVNTQATDIFNANFGIKLKNGDVVIG